MNNSHKFDLIFISTFVTHGNIDRLIMSICDSSTNTKLKILMLVVCQNSLRLEFRDTGAVQIKSINCSTVFSLSKARNIAIEYILNREIKSDYVMFPDDDSTFDRNFFTQYLCLEKGHNYIIDVYCAGTKKLFKKQDSKSSCKLFRRKDWNVACSVNMLISFASFLEVAFFDEMLGVGSKYGAGEDNDYFIRICLLSDGFYYNKNLYNFHPAIKEVSSKYTMRQLIRRYKQYGMGVVACLCKHRMFFDALAVCLRALIGGILSLFLLKFKLGFAYFVSFYFRIKILFQSAKSNRDKEVCFLEKTNC